MFPGLRKHTPKYATLDFHLRVPWKQQQQGRLFLRRVFSYLPKDQIQQQRTQVPAIRRKINSRPQRKKTENQTSHQSTDELCPGLMAILQSCSSPSKNSLHSKNVYRPHSISPVKGVFKFNICPSLSFIFCVSHTH